MDSSILLSIATFIYGLSSLFYVAGAVFKNRIFLLIGRYSACFGIIIIAIGILFRWLESYAMGIGHAPLSNLYESLVFFALSLASVYIFFEKKYGNAYIGAFSIPIAFFSMAYASLSPHINSSIQPLVPALQSNWLIAHVVTCFLGYAAFTISFSLSVLYLIKIKNDTESSILSTFLSAPYYIEQLNYQMVTFGFLFLSAGIVTGSIWANSAWGSYWSWDPKETWSLITWFLYAILIHARLIKNWSGKRMAFISIIGFMAMLFTYFGVNYLSGLHSYATR